MNSKYILSKICLLTIVPFLIFTTTATSVLAEENNGVFASHALELDIAPNLTSKGKYTMQITNNNESPANSVHFQLPFSDVHDTAMTIDGEKVPLSIQPIVGGTEFNSEFPSAAIIPRQKKTVVLTFASGPIATNQFGLTQFYMSKVTADHVITEATIYLKYPATFPPLLYTSAMNLTDKPHEVKLSGLNGMLVQWGDKFEAQLQETVPLDLSRGLDNVLFNLITSHNSQTAVYTAISNLELAGADAAGNIWGLAQPGNAANQIKYDLNWVSRAGSSYAPTFAPRIDYGGDQIVLPETMGKFTFGKSKQEIMIGVNEYMLTGFSAAGDSGDKQQNILQTFNQINQGNRVLSDLQYAYVAAALCQKLGVDAKVYYGYMLGPDFGTVETAVPRSWVEGVLEDGKAFLLDPHLEKLSNGYAFAGTTTANRIYVGIWNPKFTRDSVLGMLVSGLRMRPPLNPLSKQAVSPDEFALSVDFPPVIKGGEFYFGNVTLHNDSNQFMPVSTVKLNSEDYTDRLLQLTPDLRRVFLPFSTTKLDFVWLRETNFLAEGTRKMDVVITPAIDTIPVLQATDTVKFVANSSALTLILALIVVVMLLLLVGVGYLLAQDMKIGWRLRRNYKQSVKKGSGGVKKLIYHDTVHVVD